MSKIGNFLWEEPSKVRDYAGDKFIEYPTKAMDSFNDGITIYLDENKKRLTDLGTIIAELMQLSGTTQKYEKSFYKQCDIVARKFFCSVTNNGELICDDVDYSLGLVEITQAATALSALSSYADIWCELDKKQN